MKVRSEQRAFGGVQGFYEHDSHQCSGPMRFSVYMPPDAKNVPVIYYLAGLTCTEDTFMIKAGAQRVAAQLGVGLVTCDTSPRATRYPGDDADWDFGVGAGFYLDATEEPWSAAYRMYSYVVDELPALIEREFPVNGTRGIFGHSMGGHGALVAALRHPQRYRSISAFAPVVAPSQVPWGEKAFGRYLGADRARWAEWDTVELLRAGRRFPGTLLIDQGTTDQFLEKQLRPELLRAAAGDQPLELRMREGYDHSYYFVASFMEEHLRHHAATLCQS